MIQDENCRAGRSFIPVAEAFQQWDKEPEFRAAYDALEGEFGIANTLVETHDDRDKTEEQVSQGDLD